MNPPMTFPIAHRSRGALFFTWPIHAAFAAIALLSGMAFSAEHPRLLLQPQDLSRIRTAIGLTGRTDSPVNLAESAADWRQLQAYFHARESDPLMNGELAAVAFLYMIEPHSPDAPRWIAWVEEALGDVLSSKHERVEQALALDWCWDGLNADVRRDFLTEARVRPRALSASDSPLETRAFRDRLATLALVIAVGDSEDSAPSWPDQRRSLAAGASDYFEKSFPAFLERRGLAPASPGTAADEELNIILAIEMADALDPKLGWERHRALAGRLMEHYVLVNAGGIPRRGFLRDDASRSPTLPISDWESLSPITALLLAARTRDPAASYEAQRVNAALRAPGGPAGYCRWSSIAFETRNLPACDEFRLPAARNLGSALVLRGREIAGQPLVIWIESTPAFLRRGQHFDAGHFLVRAGTDLVVGAGDAVSTEAIIAKGGAQNLGTERNPFDFEQFACATISHNSLVFCDTARLAAWYGKPFFPLGGQRPQEGDCHDFGAPLESDPHRTCRLLAYGASDEAVYGQLELGPAYDSRTVSHYTREFVFIDGRQLLIIDRAKSTRISPTWLLQIPTRPTVDGQDLNSGARSAGADNDAGVWKYAPASVHWVNGSAGAWATFLRPADGRLAVVGGPARPQIVPRGDAAGRSYVGGDGDSFERLILPSSRSNPRNAWYRLGEPTLLGPDVGATPLWGRIEFEPSRPAERHLFVTLLSFGPAAGNVAPAAELETVGELLKIKLRTGDTQRVVEISETGPGGRLRTGTSQESTWEFPTRVAADAPLPIQPVRP